MSVSPRFRVDIQALRGLAVLLVLLYHAELLGLSAGYLGVDICGADLCRNARDNSGMRFPRFAGQVRYGAPTSFSSSRSFSTGDS